MIEIENQMLALLVFSFSLSAFSCFFLIRLLNKRNIVDVSCKRSNHTSPTPRGGGIGVLLSIVSGFIGLTYFSLPAPSTFIIFGATLLAFVSFLDDLRGELSILFRILTQIIVVGLCLETQFSSTLFFAGKLPYVLDHLIMGLFWISFINIFNFMDGINGISVIETSTISLGVFFLGIFLSTPSVHNGFALVLLGAVLGFFVWNIKGKIFLGDVGSIPLGFLLGFSLVSVWVNYSFIYSLILPLYYALDAGITIFLRAAHKEKIWEPHSQHFYQKAFRGRGKLYQILLTILLGNITVLALIFLLNKICLFFLSLVVGLIQILVLIRYSTPSQKIKKIKK